jgi:aryl-alcohol dehydrogenase-like predicted oxidoreductase
LRVTPLGIGMAALGRPGYINLGHGEDYRDGRTVEDMERRAFAVLDAAWDAGVRYFDAARSYGRGEAFLGAWLRRREIPDGDAVVASKWGYRYTADWRVQAAHHEIKDHSLAVLQQQRKESRENLGGISTSTRSIRPPSTAACWRTARCIGSFPGCRAKAS